MVWLRTNRIIHFYTDSLELQESLNPGRSLCSRILGRNTDLRRGFVRLLLSRASLDRVDHPVVGVVFVLLLIVGVILVLVLIMGSRTSSLDCVNSQHSVLRGRQQFPVKFSIVLERLEHFVSIFSSALLCRSIQQPIPSTNMCDYVSRVIC